MTNSFPEVAPREAPRFWLIAVLIFAMLLPTVSTWLYFIVLSGHAGMQLAYGGSKVVQFTLPILWIALVERRGPRLKKPELKELVAGMLLGLLIVALGMTAYYGYFKSSVYLANAPDLVRLKLADMRLEAPLLFVAFATFVALPHSLLEEYYWRWFVFGQLRRVTPLAAAIALSSLAFMAHHVIVLDRFLQGHWQITAVFSVCVAIGGVAWAWLFQRTNSLYGPWVSHLMVDAGIMWIGYDLVWGIGG